MVWIHIFLSFFLLVLYFLILVQCTCTVSITDFLNYVCFIIISKSIYCHDKILSCPAVSYMQFLKLLYALFKNGLYEWMNEWMHAWMNVYSIYYVPGTIFVTLRIHKFTNFKGFFSIIDYRIKLWGLSFLTSWIFCHILFYYKKLPYLRRACNYQNASEYFVHSWEKQKHKRREAQIKYNSWKWIIFTFNLSWSTNIRKCEITEKNEVAVGNLKQ